MAAVLEDRQHSARVLGVGGPAETLVAGYISSTYRDAIAFAILIVILLVKLSAVGARGHGEGLTDERLGTARTRHDREIRVKPKAVCPRGTVFPFRRMLRLAGMGIALWLIDRFVRRQ